jgi:hypothetical protein
MHGARVTLTPFMLKPLFKAPKMSNDKIIQSLIRSGILPDPNFVPRETKVNRFGIMIWDHKTAGHCQVLNGESYSNARKYNVPRKGFCSVVKSIAG